MKKDSRSREYILYPLILLAAIVFLPCVPTSLLSHPDPVDHTDKRVRTPLTSEDLRSVTRAIRRGRVNSIYEIVRYKTRKPLLAINADRSAGVRGRVLEVMVGEICGPFCGAGETYRLVREQGQWRVIGISEWVS